jgi:hypothetical protein
LWHEFLSVERYIPRLLYHASWRLIVQYFDTKSVPLGLPNWIFEVFAIDLD